MRPGGKMVFGILLLISGISWYTQKWFWGTGLTNLDALLVGIKGWFGVILLLTGFLIVWIEADEIRLEKELEKRDQQRAAAEDAQDTVQENKPDKDEKGTGFTCTQCGNTYDTERGLNIHKTRSHGKQ